MKDECFYPKSARGFIQTHFVRLASFMDIGNSIKILHKASLLKESKTFFKSVNGCAISSLHSHFYFKYLANIYIYTYIYIYTHICVCGFRDMEMEVYQH